MFTVYNCSCSSLCDSEVCGGQQPAVTLLPSVPEKKQDLTIREEMTDLTVFVRHTVGFERHSENREKTTSVKALGSLNTSMRNESILRYQHNVHV